MKSRTVSLLFAVGLAVLPVSAQKKKSQVRVTATAHSATVTWTQATIPAGATCPDGSTSTAVTNNNVYRATTTGGEGTTPYATLTPAGTTYTDTTVTAGQKYFYQVSALNCSGEGTKSSEASTTIPNPLLPNAPTGVTVTGQ